MKKDGYDDSMTVLLRGVEGAFSGSQCEIRLGQTVTVGRSRVCEFHPKLTDMKNRAQVLKKMSRRHLRISFCNRQHIELEDLSSNGTFLNGKRIDKIVLKNLQGEPAILDLLAGTVLLELQSKPRKNDL